MKNIEIEFRAIFSKEKYESLLNFLLGNAEHLGQDDKNVFFYLLEGKLLKISDNISKNKGKITLKIGSIGESSSFEEIEFPISRGDIPVAKSLFENLGYIDPQESHQKRVNFLYRGVEIALKYSKTWGYHIELEKIINNDSQRALAENEIVDVANELGVSLMTNDELLLFKENHDKKQG